MPVAQLITELDTSVFEGLKSEDGELCTAEVTTPTGLEDVCAEEVQEKFGVQAHATTGRAFFDVPLQRLPQVLELRSVENVHVVIHMQPHFPFTNVREDCFKALFSLVQGPLWRKGVRAHRIVHGDLEADPFAVDKPLNKEFQEPKPLLDLRLLRKGSPVALNLPEDVRLLREQQSSFDPEPALVRGSSSGCVQRNGGDPGAVKSEGDRPASAELAGTSNASCKNGQKYKESNLVQPSTPESSTVNGDVVDSLSNCVIDATDASTPAMSTRNLNSDAENLAADCSNSDLESSSLSTSLSLDDSARADEGICNGLNDKLERPVVRADKSADSIPANESQRSTRDDSSGPSFRVSCNRAGTEHVFGSSEAARQLGAAINDRFSWPVRLKGQVLEVILNITDDFVYISLGMTKQPLYRRNLVSFGPTNLRATLCYALVHLARPRPGDLVVDHMCGGASVTIEGAVCFPHCFHVGGELNSKAVDRAAANLAHMVEQTGASLPAGIIKWDATRIPFRDSSVDVVVSDLPFGKRSGSRVDNRTLYLSALRETARVVRPGTGRAVLLTHDRNSLIKNLAFVREFWRNPSTRTINIGGLYAGVFLLFRTAAKYTHAS